MHPSLLLFRAFASGRATLKLNLKNWALTGSKVDRWEGRKKGFTDPLNEAWGLSCASAVGISPFNGCLEPAWDLQRKQSDRKRHRKGDRTTMQTGMSSCVLTCVHAQDTCATACVCTLFGGGIPSSSGISPTDTSFLCPRSSSSSLPLSLASPRSSPVTCLPKKNRRKIAR